MAQRIRSNNRIATSVVFKSKSDHMRTLFTEGKSIVEVAATVGVGYAFAYGVAKSAGFAETAATRKSVKRVTITDDAVVIQTTAGPITVKIDGTVIRPTVKRTAKPKPAVITA